MSEVLVRAVTVRKTLGTALVLDGVTVEVRRGDIVGLLGANGAGKTTLIRVLLGLLQPDAGTVEGAIVGSPRAAGYLPEERGLYQRCTVKNTLCYLGRLRGLGAAAASAEATRWLSRVDMAAFAGRRVEQLSKGQQQKAQLAAACLGDSELLVLDEPFSGLDPLNARLVCAMAREKACKGHAVLLSAHQLALVDRICTHIVMLARGRVVMAGRLEELRGTRGRTLDALFEEHAGGHRASED